MQKTRCVERKCERFVPTWSVVERIGLWLSWFWLRHAIHHISQIALLNKNSWQWLKTTTYRMCLLCTRGMDIKYSTYFTLSYRRNTAGYRQSIESALSRTNRNPCRRLRILRLLQQQQRILQQQRKRKQQQQVQQQRKLLGLQFCPWFARNLRRCSQ